MAVKSEELPIRTSRENKLSSVNGVPIAIVVGLVVIFIIVAGYLVFMVVQTNASLPEVVDINQVFVDVNGDGKTDLILRGEVILNTGQVNFLKSQTTP